MVERTVLVGLNDAAFAGTRVVLSQVLAASAAARFSAELASGGSDGQKLARPPHIFALGEGAGAVALEHVEGAALSYGGSELLLLALNAEVAGDAVLPRALELVARILPPGSAAGTHVVVLAALRFMPQGAHAAKTHVAQLGGAGAGSPVGWVQRTLDASEELPAALRALPALDSSTRLHDRMLATLFQLLVARGARVTLLAVSSLAAGSTEAAADALPVGAALDSRLRSQLGPSR
ncbi:hypothetical protein T492DRAFT_870501 [Pavlovales sp. CCMP2436]|nr:hypothetical protein T492DRAFT_870501 [Pavlovales sp. CCMP2436]